MWHRYTLFLQRGAPELAKLVYKPHEYYSYLRIIKPSEFEVMFTNFAIVNGGPTL